MVKAKTSKGKSAETKDASLDMVKTLTESLKNLELSHTQQMKEMQNRLIAMERTQQNRLPPKGNDRWQKKSNQYQEQRPPTQLEPNNVVSHEEPPYCRICEEFHEESTCVRFKYFDEITSLSMKEIIMLVSQIT